MLPDYVLMTSPSLRHILTAKSSLVFGGYIVFFL